LIRIASCQTNRLFILLERAEKEIRFSMANGTFKTKMDIHRHGPRLIPNNCKNLNPPYFSLPSTFKAYYACFSGICSKLKSGIVIQGENAQGTIRRFFSVIFLSRDVKGTGSLDSRGGQRSMFFRSAIHNSTALLS
jgi:hypothetical protein